MRKIFRQLSNIKKGVVAVVMVVGSLFLWQNNGFAQAQSPCDANPFCSDSSYTFPNAYGGSFGSGDPAISGPNYGCLFTQPNAIWYFMQIGTAGTLHLNISQTNTAGTPIDIDYAMWGPYPDLATGCASVLAGAPPLQCSYSASATENIGIGMTGGYGGGQSNPPAAQVGDVYIVVMTNYNGSQGTISFEQDGGTGAADCGIVCGLRTTTDSLACAGGTFHLGASNDNDTDYTYTYFWEGPFGLTSTLQNPSFSIAQAGNYTFTVRSISNNDDTCFATADIQILPTPAKDIYEEICDGDSYDFYGNQLTQSGTYVQVLNTVMGCDSSITLHLTVNPLPDVTLDQGSLLSMCQGDSVIISVANPLASTTYQWNRSGSPIVGRTGPIYISKGSGNFSVTATTDKGCVATSASVDVEVYRQPEAKINPTGNEIICAYDTLALSAKDPGAGDDYRWYPTKPFFTVGGNEGSSVKGVFLDEATMVKVTVTTRHGCFSEDSVLVRTKPCCEVFIPNAFTPNGDGLNDYFLPELQLGQIITNLRIFNRYGEVVYTHKQPTKGWDGTMKDGKAAPADTYMYRVEYTCADGKLYVKKGSVNLLR